MPEIVVVDITNAVKEAYQQLELKLDMFEIERLVNAKKAEEDFGGLTKLFEQQMAWEDDRLFKSIDEYMGEGRLSTAELRGRHSSIREYLRGIASEMAKGTIDKEEVGELEDGLDAVLASHSKALEEVACPWADSHLDEKTKEALFFSVPKPE